MPPSSKNMSQNVQRRRGRLPRIPKGANEVSKRNRVYMSTWEKEEPKIDSIYEDIGGWKGRVTWGDLKVNEYPVRTLYIRCPRKVFSYYESELRRLRAEKANAGGSAREQVHESASEPSTPLTPIIAPQPLQQWRAPEADMYGHNSAKSFRVTKSGQDQFPGHTSAW